MREDVTLRREVGPGKHPRRTDDTHDTHDTKAPRPDGSSRDGAARRHSPVVLVVDDEADMRSLLAELLEQAGYKVIVAENGADALHAAQCERPNVVLTDYTMPGLDGPGLIRRLRKQAATRNIPVIAMSATHLSRQTLGDVPFIAKPFEVEEILETVALHTSDPHIPRDGQRDSNEIATR
jgi:CheY-like chemotaxis protein